MKKASEYRKHAQECRELAGLMMQEDRREQLLRMAMVWDEMAEARDRARSAGLVDDADADAIAAPEDPVREEAGA